MNLFVLVNNSIAEFLLKKFGNLLVSEKRNDFGFLEMDERREPSLR